MILESGEAEDAARETEGDWTSSDGVSRVAGEGGFGDSSSLDGSSSSSGGGESSLSGVDCREAMAGTFCFVSSGGGDRDELLSGDGEEGFCWACGGL